MLHFTQGLPERLFDTLLSHAFCYLSRTQASPYKEQIIKAFDTATKKKVPLPMYFDLGPGYHAALERSGKRQLSFDVGLGELLVLYQIRRFSGRIKKIYALGAEFSIVIDNICAIFVNDINPRDTEGYCRRFRDLISDLRMDNEVRLLVESEHFSVTDYDVKPISEEVIRSIRLSDDEYENVKRFLGRDCPIEDAIRRTLVYKQIGDRTDELFAKYFYDGVHMTQRASKSTISFRPFPGGDSRIQAGKVVLGINRKGRLYPFLLTSMSVDRYTCESFSFPEVLPKAIREVTFASKRHNTS